MTNNTVKQHFGVTREDRRKQHKHNSFLLWFTGLSGSGKSTVANAVEQALFKKGVSTYLLDGDNIRQGLNKDLSFTQEGRKENIRRIAEVSNLLVDAGTVVLAAFIAPFEKERENIRTIVGTENYVEVYMTTSIEECERRDVKGLYKKARKGEISDFTGVSSPYEPPVSADLEIDTEKTSVDEAVEMILEKIRTKLERA
jgi:adenylylsulfate kinase